MKGAPKGNQYAKGNKGGGRSGYEYEQEHLKKMRQHVSWLFAYIDAVRKGKATEKQHIAFQKLERVLLKEMDKLHANKQQTEITGNTELPFLIKIIKDADTTTEGENSQILP